MSDSISLPEAIRNHRQFPQDFCAVSAFECIAKLHGLIPPDSFPLQLNQANVGKGFGETDFLKSLGIITSQPPELDIESALNLIEEETNEGRFPLISLLVVQGNRSGYHVHLSALYNGELVLIDPAVPRVKASKREGLAKEFQNALNLDSTRQTIHVLIYQNNNQSKNK